MELQSKSAKTLRSFWKNFSTYVVVWWTGSKHQLLRSSACLLHTGWSSTPQTELTHGQRAPPPTPLRARLPALIKACLSWLANQSAGAGLSLMAWSTHPWFNNPLGGHCQLSDHTSSAKQPGTGRVRFQQIGPSLLRTAWLHCGGERDLAGFSTTEILWVYLVASGNNLALMKPLGNLMLFSCVSCVKTALGVKFVMDCYFCMDCVFISKLLFPQVLVSF